MHNVSESVRPALVALLALKSAIIFWPTGESSNDDAGDRASESNARSQEGVIGGRNFGLLDWICARVCQFVALYRGKGRKHTCEHSPHRL